MHSLLTIIVSTTHVKLHRAVFALYKQSSIIINLCASLIFTDKGMGGVVLTYVVPKYGVLASWCNFPVILNVAQMKQQHLLHKKALLPGVILLIQEEN